MASLDEFLSDVARSGLVRSADLNPVRAEVVDRDALDAPDRLAKILIDRGFLTSYQANKLLAGMTRGFFLGGYRILRRLGQGGMGKVYLAAHEKDGSRVAIKVLPPKKAMESSQALARFRREMDLSRRVVHPNIARTIDVGSDGPVHFMVMEYIPGDSLYNLIRGKRGTPSPFRVPDAARIFVKLADALKAAHAEGLIHRDIKPSNLMITPDGDVKLLDLGLARATGDESPLTRPNVVIGTLDYASPEQLADAARADARSDLYSVGCTLYFALAGRPPFEGGDVVNKIFKQRMEDPDPIERVARGVPAAFGAIVRRLMAKPPGDRYQSADELRTDLLRWTDPARVRALLGAEAEAARAFRPPAPELSDDELRLPDEDTLPGVGLTSLRSLGDAEPAEAPLSRLDGHSGPRVAVVTPTPKRPAPAYPDLPPLPPRPADDQRWLIGFVLAAFLLGALVVAILALIR